MKPVAYPVFIFFLDDVDCEVCLSESEVRAAVEPPDLKNGYVVGFDARGFPVRLKLEGRCKEKARRFLESLGPKEYVAVEGADETPIAASELSERLRRCLAFHGIASAEELEQKDLCSLVNLATAAKLAEQKRRAERRLLGRMHRWVERFFR